MGGGVSFPFSHLSIAVWVYMTALVLVVALLRACFYMRIPSWGVRLKFKDGTSLGRGGDVTGYGFPNSSKTIRKSSNGNWIAISQFRVTLSISVARVCVDFSDLYSVGVFLDWAFIGFSGVLPLGMFWRLLGLESLPVFICRNH